VHLMPEYCAITPRCVDYLHQNTNKRTDNDDDDDDHDDDVDSISLSEQSHTLAAMYVAV